MDAARPQVQLRVLIADDHRLFAQALRALLVEDERIDVVGIANDGEEAVSLASTLLPDVVLMDYKMPGVDGLEATRRIRERDVAAQIVLLTGAGDEIDAGEAFEVGANAFLRKEEGVEELSKIFLEVASLTMLAAAKATEAE